MVQKTIVCKTCDASFIPETSFQKQTRTCKECLTKLNIRELDLNDRNTKMKKEEKGENGR